MIPDEVGAVCLALDGERIIIEVSDSHSVGVQATQRNVFLFQWIVGGLFAFISAHVYYLHCYSVKVLSSSHHGSQLTYNNRSTPKRFGLSLVFIWSLKLQNRRKKKIKKSDDNTLKSPKTGDFANN